MSNAIQSLVFRGGPSGLAEHSVMIALAARADEEGCAWPGVKLLGWEARLGEEKLRRVIGRLERDGWLAVEARGAHVATLRGLVRQGNLYRLNIGKLKMAAARSDEQFVHQRSLSGSAEKPVDEARILERRDAKTGSTRRENGVDETRKQGPFNGTLEPLNQEQEIPPNPPSAVEAAETAPDGALQLCLGVGKARTTASAKATATTSSLRAAAVIAGSGGEAGASSARRGWRDPAAERESLDGFEAALWDEAARVLEACGVAPENSTRSMRQVVIAALRWRVERACVTVSEAGDFAIAQRRFYVEQAAAAKIAQRVGVRRFFRDGLWLEDWRPGAKASQLSAASLGMSRSAQKAIAELDADRARWERERREG